MSKTDEEIINEADKIWGIQVESNYADIVISLCNQRERERVEELKKSIDNLYRQFNKGELWSWSNDTVCEECESLVLIKIDEIFGSNRE